VLSGLVAALKSRRTYILNVSRMAPAFDASRSNAQPWSRVLTANAAASRSMPHHGWTDAAHALRRRLSGRCAMSMFSAVVMEKLTCCVSAKSSRDRLSLIRDATLADDNCRVKHFMQVTCILCKKRYTPWIDL